MTDKQEQDVHSLYKDGSFHADNWQFLGEEEDHSGRDGVLLPFEKALALLKDQANLPAQFGLVVEPSDDVEELADYLDQISLIAISFPAFADGRGFSSARLLRERLGYEGEIRAIGNYLLDQMPFLLRCGVDSFVISSPKLRAGLERGEWPEVTNYYQPTGQDGFETIANRPWLRQRRG